MANNYLVISPNGYGNIGDDICAYSGRYAIEQADPSAEVVISSPPMDKKLVKWADYVILSGGGIIYDRAPKNLENYMQYIDLATKLGKKTAVMGIGVQGIVTSKGKKRYKESLSKCEFVSVRTETDKKMLDEIGFTSAIPTFDIAFFASDMVSTLDTKLSLRRKLRNKKFLSQMHSSQRLKIGICMINLKMLKRDQYGGDFEKFDNTIENFVKNSVDKYEVYMIQHAKEDGKLMREISKRHAATFVPYRNINDLPMIYELYNNLDLMIGVRLHSIALGLMSNTPTIGIGSSNAKQKRLAEYSLPTLDKQFYPFPKVNQLSKLLEDISLGGKINISKLTKNEVKFIHEQNLKNVDLIKQMIN